MALPFLFFILPTGRWADGEQERPDRFNEATGPALVPIETAMEAMGGSKGR